MLGKTLAANLGKQPGDKLDVAAREEFEVVGVYESFSPLENGWLIMPLAELQRMMDRQGKVMVISVVARQPDEETILALRDEIAAMASNLEVLPARSFVGSMVEIRLARAMAWMTSALALFVGAISMLNTMLAAVHERTRELAVLRAVGWRKTSVLRLVLIEAVLLALGSAALGTLLGLGAVHLLSLFPTAGRLVVGDIGWDVIAQGFAVAVVLGVLGGLYPACRAARQVPTEGLRHD
jgi:putative ABC transport system permease protein